MIYDIPKNSLVPSFSPEPPKHYPGFCLVTSAYRGISCIKAQVVPVDPCTAHSHEKHIKNTNKNSHRYHKLFTITMFRVHPYMGHVPPKDLSLRSENIAINDKIATPEPRDVYRSPAEEDG